MKLIGMFLLLIIGFQLAAQDKGLPYYEIPSYPENYSAGSVAARIVDGLGFRFYWATEGLRPEDLDFKPNPEARTTEETVGHIYGMSIIILNATIRKINATGRHKKLSFAEMRKRTLENLKAASDNLRASSTKDLKDYKAMFEQQDKIVELPFWNLLNGPIADCLWHVGQIVSFRRSSGNPFSERVDVFRGMVKD
jgi:hypothetical protein